LKNLITDPVTQGEYFGQYISHALRYKDQSRKGAFVRYYNINRTLMNTTDTKSVLHNKDHFYDIYEYTPTWSIDEISDATETDDNGKLKFVGATSITVYTIDYPTVHDLIAFVYPPYNTNHVFRVKNLTTVLRERDANLKIFKLDLEFAYDSDVIDTLPISKHSVYSVFDGKNIDMTKYQLIMAERVVIQNTLDMIQPLFDSYQELFGSGSADVYNNARIYEYLTTNKAIQQYFDSKVPYGATPYIGNSAGDVVTYGLNTVASGPPIVTTVTNIRDYVYNSSTALADVVSMFSKFLGVGA